MELAEYRFKYKRICAIDEDTKKKVEVFYPYVPCSLASSTKSTSTMEALLDSGCDGVVVPMGIAKYLNLELKRASPMKVVGSEVPCYTSTLSITVGRAGRYCGPIKDVEVSVPEDDDTPLILGRDPFFKLYIITFIEAEQRFEMVPYKKQ